MAEHACLEALAHYAPGGDAALVAANFDSGVRAGREMLSIPMLGITEASLHVADLVGSRFGAVVINPRIVPVLREMVHGYGFGAKLCGVCPLSGGVLDAFKSPDILADAIIKAADELVEQHGAEVVILFDAVLGGMPPRVQAQITVPVIEGLSCAVALVRLQIPRARADSFAPLPASEQVGLGRALGSQFG